MRWIDPPLKQIYGALTCISDDRIEVEGNSAKVYSSSRGKYYTVKYDGEKNAIMSNDNTAYWKGYLSYPSIAFLMKTGVLDYNPKYSEALKGVIWKDVNVKFKNDFDKAIEYVRDTTLKPYSVYSSRTGSTATGQVTKFHLKIGDDEVLKYVTATYKERAAEIINYLTLFKSH